ncbi:MAG: glycoside hydrolase family 9 protein [Phycisphaerales bacterium]|jgi:hypothetical protein|nr:glycoside hydrolase family 9 protein [Phycisphaerales bacterium]
MMKKFNRLYCTSGMAAFAIAFSTHGLRADGRQSACPADFDQSGAVDINDFSQFLVAWGSTNSTYDLDNSGQVDLGDFSLFLVAFGQCPEIVEGPFNYHEALQKAVTFYDAQRSGDLPDDYSLNWRGDCYDEIELIQQRNGQYDFDPAIINRYMDAGDTSTFVLPISSAMTIMAWGGIEFGDGFNASDQMDRLLETLRWHADWCIAAHPEPNVFCGQIGDGAPSHIAWGPVEPDVPQPEDGYYYPLEWVWWLNAENPGSEPAGESAAFLAAASILFEETDPDYAATLLQHARELYAFADTYRGTYTDSIPEIDNYYDSWTGYFDELAWSAAWIYRATGEQTYLDQAEAHFDSANEDPNWSHSWDGKTNGAACLLAGLTGKQEYKDYMEDHLGNWLPGGSVAYTPGGLAWLSEWGSLRYAANTAFIAFVYADTVEDPDGRYQQFGEQQINYMLGDNPRNSSYVCGFGNNPPLKPHHRSAHGSWNNWIEDPDPNRNELWGALVGGPASADDYDFADVRSDYVRNEVTCDYNAGFVAALGRMAREYNGTTLPNFPPKEDPYGKEMFVEASIISDGNSSTTIRCRINNRSNFPARPSESLAYRIYVDLSEVFSAGYDVEDVVIDSGFLDGGSLGSLVIANASSNLYFVEVSYAGQDITPGFGNRYRRDAEFTIGLSNAAADVWDSSNDPSLADLPFGQSAIAKTEMIPVYDAGILIYGEQGLLDCNDNGIADVDEIASGAADIDGNGQLDECQADCDGDGLPDSYEIANGDADCDGDSIPDGCQSFDDCDNDGTADACAIAQGLVADCNGNGVPDSCDITNGLDDSDSDGVPDACQISGITYRFVQNDVWQGGFTADLFITNNSDQPLEDWTASWNANYTVVNAWASQFQSQVNGVVTVIHPTWDDTLQSGESAQIGFEGAGQASEPTEVFINGIEVTNEN